MSNELKSDPPVETPDRATLAARWEHRTATWLAFTDQPLSEFMRPFEREGWQIAAVTTGRNGGWCVFMKRQAADALAATAWQPLDTAPKDGTRILVVCNCWNTEPMQCVVEWSDRANGSFNWNDTEYTHTPTHWMLLPPPPPTGRTE